MSSKKLISFRAVWKCSLCHAESIDAVFDNRDDFYDHFQRYCHICKLEFTSEPTLKQHYNRHMVYRDNKPMLLCSLCGTTFLVKAAFVKHMSRHKIYACAGCHQDLNSFKEVGSHVRSCAKCGPDAAKVHRQCYGCQARFQVQHMLMDHFRLCEKALIRDNKNSGVPVGQIRDDLIRSVHRLNDARIKNIDESTIIVTAPHPAEIDDPDDLIRTTELNDSEAVWKDDSPADEAPKIRVVDIRTLMSEDVAIAQTNSDESSGCEDPLLELAAKVIEQKKDVFERIMHKSTLSKSSRKLLKSTRPCRVRMARMKLTPADLMKGYVLTNVQIPKDLDSWISNPEHWWSFLDGQELTEMSVDPDDVGVANYPDDGQSDFTGWTKNEWYPRY